MKQLQQVQTQKEEAVSVSIGEKYSEFLVLKGEKKGKNLLPEFDQLSKITLLTVDGKVLDRNGSYETSFPAKVSEVLDLTVKPTQEVKFYPWIAGG